MNEKKIFHILKLTATKRCKNLRQSRVILAMQANANTFNTGHLNLLEDNHTLDTATHVSLEIGNEQKNNNLIVILVSKS